MGRTASSLHPASRSTEGLTGLGGSMGLQAPFSSQAFLPLSHSSAQPLLPSFFPLNPLVTNTFASKEMTRCSEPGVGSVQLTTCSLSTYCAGRCTRSACCCLSSFLPLPHMLTHVCTRRHVHMGSCTQNTPRHPDKHPHERRTHTHSCRFEDMCTPPHRISLMHTAHATHADKHMHRQAGPHTQPSRAARGAGGD